MNCYDEKKSFVENELANMAKATDKDISKLTYKVDGAEEYVTVWYASSEPYGIKFCVTGDSLQAIVKDTVKNLF